MLAVFCDVNAVVIKEVVVQPSLAVQHALLERLAGCFGIDVNRIKRSLATDIQAISHLRTEANIGHDLAHQNRSDMGAIRRVAKTLRPAEVQIFPALSQRNPSKYPAGQVAKVDELPRSGEA